MSRDLLSVEPEERVAEAAQRMVERNLGAVLVLGDGRLVGIMTERDLMRAVARGPGVGGQGGRGFMLLAGARRAGRVVPPPGAGGGGRGGSPPPPPAGL